MKFVALNVFLLCFCTALNAQDIAAIISSLKTDRQKADTLLVIARYYLLKPRFDSAAYCLNTGEAYAVKSGDEEVKTRYHIEQASTYHMMGKYRRALDEIVKADAFLSKHDIYGLTTTSLLTKGNCYNFLDKKDSALYFYRRAEEYNNLRMPYRNWAVFLSMGELFNRADDIKEAEKYYLKAYQLTLAKEGKPDLGYVLMLLSNFYIARKLPGKAGEIVQEYHDLAEERKQKNFTDPLQNIIAGVTGSRFETNVDFMKEVKESSIKAGRFKEAQIVNGYIINYYDKKKKYEEALKAAEESELLALKEEGLYNIYLSRQIKFDLLKKSGRFRDAALLADTLFDLKDSLFSVEHRQQLYELEKKYESEKKQKEIDLLASQNALNQKNIELLTNDKKLAALLLQKELLQQQALSKENELMDSVVNSEKAFSQSISKEKHKEAALNEALGRENKLKERELSKEKNLRRVITGGALLLLVAGAVILFQYRRQKIKNKVIQKQATDLEVLMKEIHHRVKNNLQIVSSLLDLQGHSITDVHAHEAVKEGKNRVQSMALIHQNLYSEGNIKGIKVQEYVNNLLQTLCDSYNISNEKIKINSDIDNLSLDVDTMIPLGLVLNELVSNAFKYAFRETQNGSLDILLKEQAGQLHLKVSDNGKGFPEGLDIKSSKSFGLKMIRAFAQKLKASLDIYNNNGAVVEMKITRYKTA